nr:PREDICTED: protein KASH5 [Struthio camelus australis]
MHCAFDCFPIPIFNRANELKAVDWWKVLCKRKKSIMSSEHGANKRHHNPVDSICRKIKSIQMMDQVSNPALQIPKFQSRNFDSPQCNIKKNLEEILKKRTFRSNRWKQSLGYKADDMYDVSLICEEDLLTTIFCACDIEHTGKVAVSKIVDYLRHTTSRGSEDSGLEELCNMLDPDQRDISVDLETYHAIMKEWIEDCKRKREDDATEEPTASMEDLEFKVHKNISEAKRMPVRMNVTSGSLEAFGGDVSKGDMETSDLITCVADLQYNNQKLQEENNKLKLTLEAVDEANNKLMVDNEDLHQQIKSIQHSVLKAKLLEEELEEAKNNLNLSEEKRQQILCQNKQLNIRNSLDTDGLQKKILELSKTAAELQTLRAEKNKLLENMQHMQQELISNGLSFPLMYKFNSSIVEGTNSLHCELELAQASEITKTEWTSLDETLDREVLFLLQGPECAGEKFKAIMQNLQAEATEPEELVMTSLQWVEDPDVNIQQAWERKLVILKQELEEKRELWIQKLHLLEKCKESIDKDFIRVAGNLRRTKTEQLHLRKELSARQREIETVKQLQEEAAGQAEALGLDLEKATKQLEDANKRAKDQVEAFLSAREEASSLKFRLEEAISEQQKLKDMNAALTSTCQLLQEKVEEQKSE